MSARDDSTPDAYFDGMYGRGPDPWHYADRHYERRKREILLATLPRARFASAFRGAGWKFSSRISRAAGRLSRR